MKNYYLYRFVDSNCMTIYIGKTHDLASRFFHSDFAHFTGGSHLADDCYKEIQDIEYLELTCESEQVIYEAALINKLRPKYNKQFVDSGHIDIDLPEFKWLTYSQFTDEVKHYLQSRKTKTQSIQEFYLNFIEESQNGDFLNSQIQTGFFELDKAVMLNKSNLVLLSGGTGTGKTAFSLNICSNLLKNKKNTLFFSLRDSIDIVRHKLLSIESAVSFAKLSSNVLTDEDWDSVGMNIENACNSPCFTICSETSMATIVKTIEQSRCDFVVIDDYHMIDNIKTSFDNDKAYDTLKKLKMVSMQANIPILLIHTISEEPLQKRQNHRPLLGDLKHSSLSSMCDTVIFLYRDEMYNPDTLKKNVIEVVVAKNKYGNSVFELAFIPQCLKVVNFHKG
ncbi:MAG: DEAD/DEAH box helicase family protein [Defluviitaleaceae bacterium]|nr:DEAD/DEAH box helicase family protein [Defluviitaleaceae bacterium]